MNGQEQTRKLTTTFPEWTPEGFGIPTGVPEPPTPLQIHATASCNGRDWQDIPGCCFAQFRILNPVVRFMLRDGIINARLDCEVETRSTARKPDGEPWIKASARFTGEVNESGEINLQFPAWPSCDSMKAPGMNARDLSEEAKEHGIKVPDFPGEAPAPPHKPKHPRPQFSLPPVPPWVAYDAALHIYQTALETYRSARQKYEQSMKVLHDALAENQNNFPDLPEDLRNLQLPSVSCRLTDLLR